LVTTPAFVWLITNPSQTPTNIDSPVAALLASQDGGRVIEVTLNRVQDDPNNPENLFHISTPYPRKSTYLCARPNGELGEALLDQNHHLEPDAWRTIPLTGQTVEESESKHVPSWDLMTAVAFDQLDLVRIILSAQPELIRASKRIWELLPDWRSLSSHDATDSMSLMREREVTLAEIATHYAAIACIRLLLQADIKVPDDLSHVLDQETFGKCYYRKLYEGITTLI